MNLKLKEAREIVASLRELERCHKELGAALDGSVNHAKELKQLLGRPGEEGGARDSLLVRAGVALVLFPDPTITDLIGGCLIAAGMMRNRSKQLSARDVRRELQETVKEIEKATRDMTH